MPSQSFITQQVTGWQSKQCILWRGLRITTNQCIQTAFSLSFIPTYHHCIRSIYSLQKSWLNEQCIVTWSLSFLVLNLVWLYIKLGRRKIMIVIHMTEPLHWMIMCLLKSLPPAVPKGYLVTVKGPFSYDVQLIYRTVAHRHLDHTRSGMSLPSNGEVSESHNDNLDMMPSINCQLMKCLIMPQITLTILLSFRELKQPSGLPHTTVIQKLEEGEV